MNNQNNQIVRLVTTALLIAIGIVIPMFVPKIYVGPMSFTIASHVAIFIAMFISPSSAIAVALGTTVGFLFTGVPPMVVWRAFSHIIFVAIGAFMLKKAPNMLRSVRSSVLFSFLMAAIHAVCEVIVVTFFYFGGTSSKMFESGYITSVVLLVGVGTLVHSMVDFGIAMLVWKPVSHVVRFPVSVKAR